MWKRQAFFQMGDLAGQMGGVIGADLLKQRHGCRMGRTRYSWVAIKLSERKVGLQDGYKQVPETETCLQHRKSCF